MRIVHVIDSVDPRHGGPPAVAVQLSAAQAAAGHEVVLVSHGHDQGGTRPLPVGFEWVPRVSEVTQVIVPRERGVATLTVPEGRRALESHVERADVLHLHGVWEPLLWNAAAVARSHGVPYVVRPAGMLDPWSLSQKKLKKRLALMLGFRQMLDRAAFVHALDRDERDLVALLGLKCPVEVVSNGVFLESLEGAPPAGSFRKRYPQLGTRPFVLFHSRLHPRKGLEQLAEAFQSISARMPELMLVVAGPDDGGAAGFTRRIERSKLQGRVVMAGPLFGGDKLAALTDAAVFCLPSRVDGFSPYVFDALAMGLPAVISEGCHFPEVAEEGAGRVVSLDPRQIGDTLLKILQTPGLRAAMSTKAREMIAAKFTWPRIGARCAELYASYKQPPSRRPAKGPAAAAVPETRELVSVPPSMTSSVSVEGTGRRLRILHVVRSLDPSAGGPPVVAVKLATSQAQLGHEAHVLGYRVPDAEDDVRALLNEVPDSRLLELHYLPEETPRERLLGTNAGRVSRTLLPRFDVVHLHGVWEALLVRVASEARRAGIPYVVTPHGMLDPWSLSQSATKKRAALFTSHGKMLDRAAFLHVLNDDERALLAPLRLRCPSEIIPNGVFESEVTDLPAPGTFRAEHPVLGDSPYVLFLSRLHFKKGLDHLADAFALLAPRLPNLRLVVAGPDGGAKADFEKRIAAANLGDRVHLVGPIYGRMKSAALVDAAAFCLPSRQEGFSMAITEALGTGIPCVVSHACHYPQVQTADAGYCTDLDPQQVADALFKVLSDPARSAQMGANGRELVLSQFTWKAIARQTTGLYEKYAAAHTV